MFPCGERKACVEGVDTIHFCSEASGSEEDFKIKIWLAAAILFLIVGIAVSGRAAVRRVTICESGYRHQVDTRAATVKGLLEEEEIVLGPYDRVEPGEDSFLQEGSEVVITRAVPVKVRYGTSVLQHWTTQSRVVGVLQELPFYLGDDMEIEPSLRSPVYAGQEIVVSLIATRAEVEEEKIPFDTVHKKDASLEQGKTKLVEKGETGIRRKTYRVVYENGVERERELVQEEVIEEPRDKVVAVGTKPVRERVLVASRGGERGEGNEVVAVFEGVASWYGSQFQGQSTASGETFDKHSFTAAHRSLPFGTRVRVTYLKTGRSVIVYINDRGPHDPSRVIDLSRAAAEEIGILRAGVGKVRAEVLK